MRKACAEALVDLSKAVSIELRGGVLLEVFSRLSTDSSQFVRQAALQQLGPFLTTLPPEKISADLLELFSSMALGEGEGREGGLGGGGMWSENNARLWCAFSLPGVLWRVGWRRWREGGKEGGLRGAYGRLVRDGHWMVRKTLACSLHEVAKVMGGEGGGEGGMGGKEEGVPVVGKEKEGEAEAEAEGGNEGGLVGEMEGLSIAGVEGRVEGEEEEEEEEEEVWRGLSGPERVAKELQFAFDFFLQDVEDVRMGVLNNMASFLSSLPPSSRRVYLPLLCEIATRTAPSQWRPREALARQLPTLLPLYPLSALHSVFLPLCFALLEDPVAVVREKVFVAFGPLYDAFAKAEEEEEEEGEEGGREALLGRLVGMANAETYVNRQLFVHVALAFPSTSRSLPPNLFLRQVLPRLLVLARDRVSNVRVSFARDVGLLPEWVFQAAEAAAAAAATGGGGGGDGSRAEAENPKEKEIISNEKGEEGGSSPLSSSSSSSSSPSSPLALTLHHLLNDDSYSDVRLYMGKCRKQRPDLAPLFASRRAAPPSLPPPQFPPPSLTPTGEGEGEKGREEGQRRPRGGSAVENVPPLSPLVPLPPSLPPSSLRPFEADTSVSLPSSCHPPPPLFRPLHPASSPPPPPPTTASSHLEDEITRLSPPPPSLTTTSSLVDMASLLLPPIATASSSLEREGEGEEEEEEEGGEDSPGFHPPVLHPSSSLEEEIALLSSPSAAAGAHPAPLSSSGFPPFPPLTSSSSSGSSSSLSDDPNAMVDPRHIHDILTHLTHDQNHGHTHTGHTHTGHTHTQHRKEKEEEYEEECIQDQDEPVTAAAAAAVAAREGGREEEWVLSLDVPAVAEATAVAAAVAVEGKERIGQEDEVEREERRNEENSSGRSSGGGGGEREGGRRLTLEEGEGEGEEEEEGANTEKR